MLMERNMVWIGAIAAVVIAFGTIFALLMTRGIFDRGEEVSAYFRDAAGLQVDDQVLAAGIRVGRVTGVEIENGVVRVDFVFSGELPDDTRARIMVQNLLGRRQLHLMAGSNWDNLLETGDVIPVERTRTPIDAPEFGETGEQLYREQDQDALQAIVTSLADIAEDKNQELGDLADGLTRVGRAVADQKEDLHATIDGAQRFFAAFRDRDEEIVRIVDAFGETLRMLVDQRNELESLLINMGHATHLLADLVSDERAVLDSMLPQLHSALRVVDRNLVDVAHFFAYGSAAVSGWQQVGYDTDGSDTPHWFNMHVDQAGAASFDMIFGCGEVLDQALDELFGPDPRECREQDPAPEPDEPPGPLGPDGRSSSLARFFVLHDPFLRLGGGAG